MIYTKKGAVECKCKDEAEVIADLYCILRLAIEEVGLDDALLHGLVEAVKMGEDDFIKILEEESEGN